MEIKQVGNLQKIKIYPEEKSKDGVAGNLILEIDGKRIDNIIDLGYRISVGGIPYIDLKVMGDIEIDSHAEVRKTIENPGLDGVEM